jgi:branched-chain amino acid transport system permease protein
VPDTTQGGSAPLLHLVLAAAIFVMVACGALLPSYYAGLLIEGMIFAIFALGLNLLMGYTGLPSLGHSAYFACGAYAAGLVALNFSSDFFLQIGAGIIASAVLSAVFGLLALRTTGVYFLMITLALAQIAWAIALSWREVTGGDDGLRGISRPTLLSFDLNLSSTVPFYFVALAAFGFAVSCVYFLLRSPFGRSLPGIQEHPLRMEALGYNIWLHKFIAFVLSGALSGFAGTIFVQYKGFVSPEAGSIVVSAEVMLMVIFGGAATLAGPIIGAFSILLLSNFISAYTTHWTFILGLLYALVVLGAPTGVVGEVRNLLRRYREARS